MAGIIYTFSQDDIIAFHNYRAELFVSARRQRLHQLYGLSILLFFAGVIGKQVGRVAFGNVLSAIAIVSAILVNILARSRGGAPYFTKGSQEGENDTYAGEHQLAAQEDGLSWDEHRTPWSVFEKVVTTPDFVVFYMRNLVGYSINDWDPTWHDPTVLLGEIVVPRQLVRAGDLEEVLREVRQHVAIESL